MDITNAEIRANLKAGRCPMCTESVFTLVTKKDEIEHRTSSNPEDIVRTLYCEECGSEFRVRFIFWDYVLEE